MKIQGNKSRLPWRGPFPLAPDAIKQNVKQTIGVYRIRAFDGDGRPVSICRANGVDADGILHVGQSGRLRARLKEFLRGAYRGARGHRAGREFHEWGFGERYPVQHLRFDYRPTRTPKYAKKLERKLHENYRAQYLDRPPLDGTSGQSK